MILTPQTQGIMKPNGLIRWNFIFINTGTGPAPSVQYTLWTAATARVQNPYWLHRVECFFVRYRAAGEVQYLPGNIRLLSTTSPVFDGADNTLAFAAGNTSNPSEFNFFLTPDRSAVDTKILLLPTMTAGLSAQINATAADPIVAADTVEIRYQLYLEKANQ